MGRPILADAAQGLACRVCVPWRMYRLGMAHPERPGTPRPVAGDDDAPEDDDLVGNDDAPEDDDLVGNDDVAEDDDLVDGEGRAEGPELPIQAGLVSPPPAWPGVLLTPEAIATYEELAPGAAERILKLAEQTAQRDTQLWSEDEGFAAGWAMVIALVFFGLAVGGVGTTAALIAGGSFTAVGLVILICGWHRWARVRRRPGGPGT
jgi:hypothetical protein